MSPPIAPPVPIGIKYIGMLPPEGYGVAAKRAVLGLGRAGVPVTFTQLPARPGEAERRVRQNPEIAPLIGRPIAYDTVIIHAQPEEFASVVAAERGKHVIGMTTWETEVLPSHWPRCIDGVERLIVPCEWNREVFARAGVRIPIHVVPHISVVDEPRAPRPAPSFSRARPFVVSAVGVWGGRKNLAAVVGAYLTAFGARDHTELVLKTTTRDLTRRVLGYYPVTTAAAVAALRLRYRSLARIRIIGETLSETGIDALLARSDCYLSMSRGEGWGLGAFDAASRGCPIITPLHGGPRDYLGASHPLAVRWREVPVEASGYEREVFERGQRWIEPEARHAAQLLRSVYESPAEPNRYAVALAGEIARRFNERSGTDAMLTALDVAPVG